MKIQKPCSGLFVLAFSVLWCLMSAMAVAAPVPMRTAWLGEHETFLVWYAKEKGWDKEMGLDLTLMPFDSGKTVIDEMQRSDWAIAGVGAMPALTATLSNKIYIIAIGNDESASNALFVREGSPILKTKGFNPNYPDVFGTPDTVRGKTILCPKGTSAHYMLSRWLHILGLTDKDVVIRDLSPNDALKAFAAGGGDAIALWAPQTYEAEKQGLKTAALSNNCDARQPILLIANHVFAEKHMNQVVDFLKVYLRGVEMLRQTPPEEYVNDYIRFYAAWTGHTLTKEEALRDIKDHPVYTLQEQLAMFDTSKGESELGTWLHGILSFHKDRGELERRDSTRLERLNFVTNLFLKKIDQN